MKKYYINLAFTFLPHILLVWFLADGAINGVEEMNFLFWSSPSYIYGFEAVWYILKFTFWIIIPVLLLMLIFQIIIIKAMRRKKAKLKYEENYSPEN